MRDGRRVSRKEGGAVLVEQPVKHDAQRINVYRAAIGLAFVDLRSHIGVGALLRQAAGGLLHGPGNSEVSQLKVPVLRDKHIFRLHIPVDDVVFLAQLQRPAHVDAQADNVLPGNRMRPGILVQRRQKLHLNQNVPADSVLMLNHLMVLVADDVAVALEPAHEGEFLYQVLHKGVKIGAHALFVHAVRHHVPQLRLAGRHRDRLQRRPVGGPEILPLYLKYLAKAALSYLTGNVPGAKDGLILSIIVDVHNGSYICKFPRILQRFLLCKSPATGASARKSTERQKRTPE